MRSTVCADGIIQACRRTSRRGRDRRAVIPRSGSIAGSVECYFVEAGERLALQIDAVYGEISVDEDISDSQPVAVEVRKAHRHGVVRTRHDLSMSGAA